MTQGNRNKAWIYEHLTAESLKEMQGRKETKAYILPNELILENTSLDSFRTTVQKKQRALPFVSKNWSST